MQPGGQVVWGSTPSVRLCDTEAGVITQTACYASLCLVRLGATAGDCILGVGEGHGVTGVATAGFMQCAMESEEVV